MSGELWAKWFWPDWLSDQGLRACSPAARGLWMDMLCIAAANEPYGYVGVNGQPLTPANLARIAGLPPKECRALVSELEKHGVFSRAENGMMYSRRMVKDRRKLEQAREFGRRGGNPNVLNGQEKKATVKGGVPPNGIKPDTRSQKDRKKPPSEVKKGASPTAPPDPRGTRLSEDWVLTTELTAYAIEHGFTEGQSWAMAEDFVLYWQARAGAGARHTDWNKTWMSWVRREEQRRGQNRSRASDAHAGRLSNLERALRAPARRAAAG